MKKMRVLAWLLIAAMLVWACPAFGEGMEVELTGDVQEVSDGIATDAGELLLDPDIDVGDIVIDMPAIDLSDALDGIEANGGGGSLSGSYQPQGGIDNDALFAGYVDMLFGKQDTLGLKPNGYAGSQLKGAVKDTYNYLLKEIEKIAAGTRSNTKIDIPDSVVSVYDAEEVFYATSKIIDALLVDCPYHLFWYDKTAATDFGYNNGAFVYFPVAQEYAADTYTTNTAKINAAHVAVTKARSVVKKYAGVSDYKKLCGYRDFICGAVEYNDDAASDSSWPYGNPWQLIWAFDDDPSTKIVCEGYSKAFQYLCDLSSFSTGVQSHIASGYAYDSSGEGAHMWNIVTMGNGKNYHVDVTFVDSGYTHDFLVGASATQYDDVYCVNGEIYYQLDAETQGVYPASVLKIATSDYDPGQEVEVKSVKLKKGGATLKNGQKLNLKRGKSLTLKAVVSPSGAKTKLTWRSSYKYVTVKNGKVKVNAKAKVGTKARITVTAANGKSAYVFIVVK